MIAVLVPVLYQQVSSRGRDVALAPPAGFEALPAPAQESLRAALLSGSVDPPALLTDLAGRSDVLMGGASQPAFRPIAPVGTAVVSDRPTFTWTPLADADRYEVSVFDEQRNVVARSEGLREPMWVPRAPLGRGRVYAWQVTAHKGSESFAIPAAPAPMARFTIVDPETAALIEQLEASRPEAHVLLGILNLRAGVRSEAERHLQAVLPSDPYFSLARRSLARLQSSRPQ